MRRPGPAYLPSRIAVVIGILVGVFVPASAGPHNAAPLKTWPAAKVRQLAPLLRSTDIAVIESEPSGQLRQISLFSLIAAAPSLVRETLLAAEHYPDFVRNFKLSKVTRRPDGSFDHAFELSYGVFSVDGGNRYLPLPADGVGEAPPVEIIDTDDGPGGTRHYRWEFYGVAGVTVLALYGYTNVRNSGGLVAKLFARIPQLEHGMALVSQATLALSIKQRAEQLQGSPPLMPAAGSAPYDFLLERGVVALLRTQNNRLSELTLIDRSQAPPGRLFDVAQQVEKWSQFIPTITKSQRASSEADSSEVELEQSLPLISFRTTYNAHTAGNPAGGGTVDLLGIGGDLKSSRMRWDIGKGATAASQLVVRSVQQFDRGSMIVRQLYRLEPLFEYSMNVGLQLVLLRAIKLRAEQK